MCFSARANFAASAVIATIGVATLRHVEQPRAVLFASTPMLFALHQFIEGFVWLGLDGKIGRVAFDHSVFLFILYAQGVLPLLMPVAVLLLKPPSGRRWAVGAMAAVGAVVFAWTTYGVMALPSQAFIDHHHSLAYRNPMTDKSWIAAGYIVATCGALLVSSHRVVRWFGLLNIVGLSVVLLVRGYAFTSIWCLYAAVLSIMLYWQFRGRHVDVDQPNRSLPGREWEAFRRAIARR